MELVQVIRGSRLGCLAIHTANTEVSVGQPMVLPPSLPSSPQMPALQAAHCASFWASPGLGVSADVRSLSTHTDQYLGLGHGTGLPNGNSLGNEHLSQIHSLCHSCPLRDLHTSFSSSVTECYLSYAWEIYPLWTLHPASQDTSTLILYLSNHLAFIQRYDGKCLTAGSLRNKTHTHIHTPVF